MGLMRLYRVTEEKFEAKKIGYCKVPVIIRVLKDDEAVVSMVVII